MKKALLISIPLILLNISISAQIKGVNFKEAVEMREGVMIWNEKLYKFPDSNSYYIQFKYTVVGVKHSYDKVQHTLLLNNKKFSETYVKGGLMPPEVKGYTDFSNIHHYASLGECEITLTWLIGEWVMIWSVTDEDVFLLFELDENLPAYIP